HAGIGVPIHLAPFSLLDSFSRDGTIGTIQNKGLVSSVASQIWAVLDMPSNGNIEMKFFRVSYASQVSGSLKGHSGVRKVLPAS
ncbi:MAG: hypothetical protein KIT39_20175, partial [Nitrospirales bacterium]|nr:hypothetical protein [Nitrospirales bacterium]